MQEGIAPDVAIEKRFTLSIDGIELNFFGSVTYGGRNLQNIMCRERVPNCSSHTMTGCTDWGERLEHTAYRSHEGLLDVSTVATGKFPFCNVCSKTN